MAVASAPSPVYYGQPNNGPTQGTAVVALILNVVLWPGLGSLIAGRVGAGLAQGLLFLLGLILTFTIFLMIIGLPLMIAMWIWGLVMGIQLIQGASR